jgi:hypothetical protein
VSELLLLGTSHKTAPLALRERIALTEGNTAPLLHELTGEARSKQLHFILALFVVSLMLVGGAVWLANLIFRYAVVASGAADLQAAVEDRAWVANQYLLGLRGAERVFLAMCDVWPDADILTARSRLPGGRASVPGA